jgi:SAM-dependent methyltransferase
MEKQSWTPERILKLSGGYWETCVLHSAVALDLFTRIGDQRIGAWKLGRQINAPEDSMARLLDAAVAMGLLTKDARGYANTPASRAYLCADADQYLGFIVQHHHHLMESWSRLPEAVSNGKPIEHPDRVTRHKKRESFLMGMFNLAMQLAPRLVPVVDLSGCRTLLDLGGGPGTYAIHFCRHYPELKATVVDLASTQPFAEETIRRMGMEQQVMFTPGDYIEDRVSGRFDAVWMSHILHGESADDCRRIIQMAADCLNPGGLAVIHEFILDDTLDRPLFPALFSLNMLLATENGRSYSRGQLGEMLEQAGLADVQRLDFQGPMDSGLIRAVKSS